MADTIWRVGETAAITAPFRKRNGQLADPTSGPRFTVIRPDTPDVKTRYVYGSAPEITRTDGVPVGSFDFAVHFDIPNDWVVGVDTGTDGAVDELTITVHDRATA